MPVLIAMRCLQGMGAAMLLPMSLTGYLALARVNTANATWRLDGALILAGVGSAIAVPSITNTMLRSVSRHDAGMAAGLVASARQMGGVIGVAGFGALISGSGTPAFMQCMAHAMLFAGASMAASLFVINRIRPPGAAPEAA